MIKLSNVHLVMIFKKELLFQLVLWAYGAKRLFKSLYYKSLEQQVTRPFRSDLIFLFKRGYVTIWSRLIKHFEFINIMNLTNSF